MSKYTRVQKYNLFNIIYDDLLICGKLQLILLFLILVSSILIILVTYKTRYMIEYREQLFLEKNILDVEWRNLVLKEKILSNYDRIEYIAVNKLHMHYIDPILAKTLN